MHFWESRRVLKKDAGEGGGDLKRGLYHFIILKFCVHVLVRII